MGRLNVPAIAAAAVSAVSVPLGGMAGYLETVHVAHEATALGGLCVVTVAALGMAATCLGGLFVAHVELARRRPRIRWNRPNDRTLFQRMQRAQTLDDARQFRALVRKGR